MATRRLLTCFAFVWAAWAVLDVFFPVLPGRQSPFTLVAWFILSGVIYRWCRAFSEEVGTEPRFGFSLLAALFAPIGVPMYLFSVLPLRQAAVGTAAAIGVLVGSLVLYALVAFAANAAAF